MHTCASKKGLNSLIAAVFLSPAFILSNRKKIAAEFSRDFYEKGGIMGENNSICLNRDYLRCWKWRSNYKAFTVFMQLLMSLGEAQNFSTGDEVPKDAVITSYKRLAVDVGLTDDQVRRIVALLVNSGDLQVKRLAKGRNMFTICHLDRYLATAGSEENRKESEETKEAAKKEPREKKAPAPKPESKRPTPEEIQAYCDERGNGLCGQEIYDFYAKSGWRYGSKNIPLVDWKAAVRTWERNSKKGNSSTTNEEQKSTSTEALEKMFAAYL